MFFKDYVTTKNIIFFILVVICLKFLSQIVGIALLFFSSYIIACSLNPLVDKLSKKMNRGVASSITLTSVVVIIFAFFVPIFVVAAKQVKALIDIAPQKLHLIQGFLDSQRFYGHRIAEFVNFDSVIGSTSAIATELVNQSINLTMNVAQVIVVFLAVVTIVFYLINDKEYIKKKFIEFFPEKMKAKAELISDNISTKVGGYVIAQVISMVALGIMTTLFLFILRIDYALLLGLAAGILDIIPVLGPTIALIAILVVCYQSGPIMIILAIVAFLVVQQISNNLIRPIVFGKFLDLSPLVVIFSLFVAGQFLGVWGIILAPALAATICVLLDELYLKPINKVK